MRRFRRREELHRVDVDAYSSSALADLVERWRAEHLLVPRTHFIPSPRPGLVVAVIDVPNRPRRVVHAGEVLLLHSDGVLRTAPAGEPPLPQILAIQHEGPDSVSAMRSWAHHCGASGLVDPAVVLWPATLAGQPVAFLDDTARSGAFITRSDWLVLSPAPLATAGTALAAQAADAEAVASPPGRAMLYKLTDTALHDRFVEVRDAAGPAPRH